MRSCSSLRRRSTSVVTVVLSPPLGRGILQKWWLLLAVIAMTTLSVVTAQSIIECILGMEDADLKNGNGDKFIDLDEYTDMLKGFLSLYYPDFHTDCHNRNNDTDSTTAVEDFFDTSFIQSTCTCQQFNNVQQHTCRCNVPNATIALPNIYPSAYTTRICSGIATNLVDAPCMNITNKILQPPGEEEEKEDDSEKTEVPDSEEEPTTPPTDRAQPSPVDDDDGDGGGGSSTTVIAVAVVLVVLVFVGTSAGLFVFYRRKKQRRFGRECRGIAQSPGGGGPGSSGGSGEHDEFQGKVRPRHGTMEKTVAADEWEEEEDDEDEVHPPLAALEEGQVEEGMVTSNSNSCDEWEDALNVIAEGEKQTLQLELDKLSDDDDSDDDYGHGPVGVDEYSVEAGETGASGISKPIKIITTGKKKRKKNKKTKGGSSSSSTPPPQDAAVAAAANADLAAAQRKKKKLEKPQSVKKVQAEYRKGRTQNMGLQPIPESSFATEPNFMNI